MNKNIKWYLIGTLGFVPLLVYNIFIPIHHLNLRPFNGTIYYVAVILVGILILGAISLTIYSISKDVRANILKRIIVALVIIYGSFTLSMRVSYLRKENHLKKFGKEIEAKVIRHEIISNKKRVYFKYTSDKKEFLGAFDYSIGELDEEDSTLTIIISTQDPRVYESIDFFY